MLKNLKIKYKILLLPFIAMIAFLGLYFENQMLNNRSDQLLKQIESGYYPSLELGWNLELALNTIHRHVQDAIATSNEQQLAENDMLNKYFIEQLSEARQNSILGDEQAYILKSKFLDYFALAHGTAQQFINHESREGLIEAQKTIFSKFTEIKIQLQRARQNEREEITTALSSARNNFHKSQRMIKSIIIFCILFLGGFSLILARSITLPLKEIVDVSDEFANGNDDVAVTFESKDEIGVLGKAFNSMIGKIKKSKQKIKKENWFKTGISELNDRMRGDTDLESLSQNIIRHITPYIGAQVGAIYLADEKDILHLTGSYAYSTGENHSCKFRFGEDFVGQCALEKRIMLISNVPDDYLFIRSGLGQRIPRNLMLVPFIYDNRACGVIELASFSEFTTFQQNFMKQAAENIAIGINSTCSRIRITELLKKTQTQANELQSQQEILQRTNQELEQQTVALKDSKLKLEKQREELRKTNDALENQTNALEKKHDEIKQKNADLELARQEIEIKAKDLELTSKYKSEFMANLSHELRTPLNSLLILSKLFSENKDNNLTPKQVQFAKTIHSSGTDLLNLINDILDLSKVEAGKLNVTFEDVEIKELADSLKRCFQHLAHGKSIDFKVEIDEDIHSVIKTDRQRVEQILKNLLSNAFKFTPGGEVRLSIEQPNQGDFVETSQPASSDMIAFSVIDTGIGLSPEHQKLIFEAFQQVDTDTSKNIQGTGLGLSISRELAKLLGGKIRLRSEKGKGSTFTLLLPMDSKALKDGETDARNGEMQPDTEPIEQTPVQATEAPQESPITEPNSSSENILDDDRDQISSSDRTILIIEDDLKFANILLDLTREKNFKGLCAVDGETGIELARRYKPHAIILDIGLPGIDGWSVMANLKDQPDTRHIPVLFISVSENSIEAKKMGAIGFLAKPVTMQQLGETFNRIEALISKKVKKLLVVEKNKSQGAVISELIGNGDVETQNVISGSGAIELLKTNSFDCMILDLMLDDMTGFDLLDQIRKDTSIPKVPVIIYSEDELSSNEHEKLREYAECIVMKGVKSKERLLDETSLFLHRIEANLPEDKKQMIRQVHDREAILGEKKILIVDDDMRNVFAISSVLEQHKMKVIIGKNGKECLKQLRENTDIDIILMDIMMPEMDGYETM
ncbi:response regulator, partial [candidate division KSB1 bacterium]|nr:response regulator [candidate division KSB1 bacterium]